MLLALGAIMTTNTDILAWLAAALTVLAWAVLPQLAFAKPVMWPDVPPVVTTILPPQGAPVEGDKRPGTVAAPRTPVAPP